VGRPSERFPWPFFGAPLLRGSELAEVELTDDARARLGASLGRFLRALHDVVLDVDLPDDPIRRADTPFRVEGTREKLAGLPDWRESTEIHSILAAACELPPSAERVLAHGDLHVRHVLVDRGVLSGVIDWGDMCRSDPAIDLMLVWSALTPVGRVRFEESYGRVDEAQRLRSRVLAIFLCVTLLLYARDVRNTGLERECLAGLERTLVDWS
jgi:aminoglycoside phosphotransferase (APT) family kinase protein